jgi:alpha-amylase
MTFSSAVVLALCLPAVQAASPSEWKSRSIYQVLTDRFAGTTETCSDLGNYCGGTFSGITENLDYIQDLGFDAIWISPVIDNAEGGYHGYWQRNMYETNSYFGSSDDLVKLSEALHKRDMFLMVDIVANHASPDSDVSNNKPFNDASYYHDCTGCNGCDVSDYTDLTQMEHCRLAGLMDFNQTDENGANAEKLYDWITGLIANYSIDGLRVDTTPYVHPAFWQRFEAAAGVYAVGEVDSGDIAFVSPWQAPNGDDGALAGILSYPMFYTIRNVWQSQQSMYQLGTQWRASYDNFADPTLLGTFSDNHDNARFMNGCSDSGLYKGALAWVILSDGIPITYYGSEWLYSGGNDPANRETLWGNGVSYSASDAPLGSFLTALNTYRKDNELYMSQQAEGWSDDTFYAFHRGENTLVAFTNVGSDGGSQSRTLPPASLPSLFASGTTVCNYLDGCNTCATVDDNGVTLSVNGADSVAIYTEYSNCKD